jgi:Bacterial regulatory helix-turn-helix protein, lysR family
MKRIVMDRSGELETFARVVQDGGFSAAARTLGLTQSAVSKVVTRLERRIGARLLTRTTRAVRLTDEGEAYYRSGLIPYGRRQIVQGFQHIDLATVSQRARHPFCNRAAACTAHPRSPLGQKRPKRLRLPRVRSSFESSHNQREAACSLRATSGCEQSQQF